jgi:peptidoglycan/LPS O-acetylase OafA/YrhL
MGQLTPPPTTHDQLPTLNALRGIAALMVCTMHFSDVFQPQVGEWLRQHTSLLDNSYLWVDFFFLLSGFVLTHVYHQHFATGVQRPVLARYMWARFARIYPLHAAMLLVLVVRETFFTLIYILRNGADTWQADWLASAPDLPFTGSFSLLELARQLLLIQSLTQDTQHVSWNFPAWSIGTEWYAYLILPLWIALLYRPLTQGRWRVGVWLLLVGAGVAALGWIGSRNLHDLDIAGFWGLGRCIIESLLGMTTYAIYRNGNLHRLLHDTRFLLLLVAGLGLIMHSNAADAWAVPLFILLMLGCTRNQGAVLQLLESGPARRLGDLSYSIYMVHTPLRILLADSWRMLTKKPLDQSFSLGGSILVVLAGLMLVILFSALTYRWIEIPAQRWLKRRRG